ncbi:MAG TPA: NAD-binding protein [Stellaceae bacterium]|jgi:voltage-gated potassium channel Kch|nr:NAD-binding protein [Stellaceae bacterium]
MTEPAPPIVLIVGGDALALNTARELCQLQGHHVTVLWSEDHEFAHQVEAVGARFVIGLPGRLGSLERAGAAEAVTILALSADDQLNLRAALRARDVNPDIRIVLRQFNRTLAPKIEENLHDCSVVSLAWLSASTYAASALDPSCFRGLHFPERDGPLTGFAGRSAEDAGVAGETVAAAESALGLRVVALGDRTDIDPGEEIPRGARLVVHGTIERLAASTPRRPATATDGAKRARRLPWRARLRRIDPFMAIFAMTALVLFAIGTWHFRYAFATNWLTAAYFVLATMTTTGYGDLAPDRNNIGDIGIAMMLMLAGIVLTGIFIGFAASLLTQARYVRMQGLRRIRRRGHIVVCGAGSIGSGVIDLLLGFGRSLVVVERAPDPAMIERARDQGFDLLTGDASRDDTLDLCNLPAAHSLVALTNVDTLNLEIALGGRVRNPDMPIVLRIADASFAASIAKHFQFETTFSAEALAAPIFAGLSRLPGARGRIEIAGEEFGIGEMVLPENYRELVPDGAFPIGVWRGKDLVRVHSLEDVLPGEAVLLLGRRAVARERGTTFAAIAERLQTGAEMSDPPVEPAESGEPVEPGEN